MDKKYTKAAARTTAATVSAVLRTAIKVFATLLLVFITTGLLFTCIFAYYVKTDLSSELGITLEDMTLNLASAIYYTDENGNEVELASLYDSENRVWVDYGNIPEYLVKATVAIEDKRFYEHKGVDWYRTLGAFGNMFLSMKNDFGGSTITQQLIKNITKEDDITVQRKIQEIFSALELETMYEKDEIMEWYLNVIYLGQGCNGVGTAAEVYFDKNVWELSLAECASLVGITNNPSKYDPYVKRANNKERQALILKEMYEQGLIDFDEYTGAVNETLVFKRAENEEYQMPLNSWYVDAVINDVLDDLVNVKGLSKAVAHSLLYNGGLQISACIDMKVQGLVDNLYGDPSNFPTVKAPNGESLQSSVVILDPYTGEIKALCGGIGVKPGNLVFSRATDAQRPPGSSIKPIAIYAPAIDQGLISPSTLVDDSPNIRLRGTTWYPRNAGGGNAGIITIQQALTSSINTVSAQILDKLTPSESFSYLQDRLGFTSLVDADRDYAPLGLGQITNGVTVREMAQAYDAFANDGVFTYARTYSLIRDADGTTVLDNSANTIVAFKENTAWTITHMLNIAATYGTGSESYFGGMPHAGKTGSSSDYNDRWFVGYTPYYVTAVWTGYDTPAYMNVNGNPAAKIWRKIMQPLHEGLEYKAFKTPTFSGPTNIFGDLMASPSPSPSEEVPESPPDGTDAPPSSSAGEPPSGTDVPSAPPTSLPPPTPSAPVTPPPTPSAPVVSPPDTAA
ncbi:MAG: PBP1A family penicillin-binding protein [Oscillospiraceae bacterium]|jgi:penicillin-binding protein 1A|nr:PBP1A family penicillin-binding protein [Oscillospiraceae bacterium]